MPDAKCVSVDVPTPHGTVRYQPDRSGSVEVSNPQHARWLIQGADCFKSVGAPMTGGYPCKTCGFASCFVRCSKCGAENPRN